MNLQRYISTVYSELIPKKYYDKMNTEINQIKPDGKLDFETLRNMYVIENKTYGTDKSIDRYLIHTLFFEILFGNTLEAVYKRTTNSVFLFPVFFDIDDSSRRLSQLIDKIYEKVLLHKKTQEFTREPSILKGKDQSPVVNSPPSGNMVLFVPVFADGDDDPKEFAERVTAYFDRAFTFINDVRQKKTNDTYGNSPDKFENIIYTIDKDNRFFTGYYKKKLPEEKSKTLNGIVEKFVEKLGCRISTVKDPILKLTRDETRKKIISDGKLDDENMKENMYKLIDKFNDFYKKTNDKEYLKLASSSENQTKFRIYYRVNNTDIVDSFAEIRPGSSYVYKIDDGETCAIGYFRERRGSTNQFIFREYKGLSATACKNNKTEDEKKKEAVDIEKEEEEDFKEDSTKEITEYIIETKNYGSVIKFKRVVKGDYKPYYPGTIELFKDLHIYEKYKWFQFNEIDGTLSPETNIKIYKNILFDTKSLIGFLKEKKLFTDKTRLAVEFLKINQSNSLLLEYVDYIVTNKKSTNVYESTFFSGKLKNFVEKNKKSILEILFQTNELIYMNPQRTSQTKENIKQNYKIITCNYYPSLYKSDVENHFNKIIYEDKEQKYCKKRTCELNPEDIKEETKDDTDKIEYAIAIIDVTKDNVEVKSELKSKATCKKLRRTLRKQLQPFLQILMPRIGGKSKRIRKKLRTRRCKNRH